MKNHYYQIYRLLDIEKLYSKNMISYIREMNEASWEFEGPEAGGRGAAYNEAQKNTDNRRVGMESLLKYFSPLCDRIPGPEAWILDVLGGDGTIARFCRSLPQDFPNVITADVSKLMVSASLAQGYPSIRQSAINSLFRDDTLDGVLIAYGTHHLDHKDRQLAVNEAHRTLKPGCRLVLHDFEIGGRAAKWFDDVVHPYSRTGHPHPHFTRGEMLDLFTKAGFRDVRIFDMDDPFTLSDASPEGAKHKAIMHMYNMYDLIKVGGSANDLEPRIESHIENTLGPIAISQQGEAHLARIPRHTLVAVGTKGTLAN